MPSTASLERFDVESQSSLAWTMLRLGDVGVAYVRIYSGEISIETLEAYCRAIRFAWYEYGAASRREPGRFDDAAEMLISMTRQVSALARNRGPKQGLCGDHFETVVKSITGHGDDLVKDLERSRAKKREEDEQWRAYNEKLNR
jgi:hypothetical protein